MTATTHTYEREIELLRVMGYNPGKIVYVSNSEEVIEGLYVYCAGIFADQKIKQFRERLGSGYKIDYLPNIYEIHISLDDGENK